MLIDKNNVSLYCFDKNLLTWEDYQAHKHIYEIKKTLNYVLCLEQKKSFFIKQLRYNDLQSRYNFLQEVKFYKFIQNSNSSLIHSIPRFLLFDQKYSILITELVINSQNFNEISKKTVSNTLIKKVSCLISDLHKIPIPTTGIFNEFKPTILSGLNEKKWNSKLYDALKNILNDEAISIALEKCCKNYNYNCIVHGDLTFNNILIQKKTKKVFIVDWEMCGIGDSHWEVGLFLCEIITTHITTNKFTLIGQNIPYDYLLNDEKLNYNIKTFLSFYEICWNNESKDKVLMFAGVAIFEKMIRMKIDLQLKGLEIIDIGKKMLLAPEKYRLLFKCKN